MRGFGGWIFAIATAIGTSGCVTLESPMSAASPPRALTPQKDHALVVFVRPDNEKHGLGGTRRDDGQGDPLISFRTRHLGLAIAHDQGSMVCTLHDNESCVVDLEPGKHVFYAWVGDLSRHAAGIEAELAANKIYYVGAAIVQIGTITDVRFVPRTRRATGASDDPIDVWVRETEQRAVDADAARSVEGRGYWHDGIEAARGALSAYGADQRNKHTILAEDGF